MPRYLHVTAALCLLAGCQAYQSTGGYWSNPVAPGAEIEVKREIRIPAGVARAYMQNGEALAGGANEYAPFCYFLMREPLPNAQYVRRGVLRVKRVSLTETQVRGALPVTVATLAVAEGGDGRSIIAMQSYMRLASDEQPDVYALVCTGGFAAPAEARPIRLHELRQVLGSLAEVRPAAGRTPAD